MRRLFKDKARDNEVKGSLSTLRQHDLDNEWLARGGGSAVVAGDSIVRIDIYNRAWVRLVVSPELWYCFTHTVMANEQPIFG